MDGGKLKEAATKKADESILIQIADKDLVALEVKYHKRCYETYTSFLRHATVLDQMTTKLKRANASMKNHSMSSVKSLLKKN